MFRWSSYGLIIIVAACAGPTPQVITTPEPTVVTQLGVPTADGRFVFRESTGALSIDYTATWQGGWRQDHLRIVNTTPGYPKATFEIFRLGTQSYRVPPTASSIEIVTGFGKLTGYQFKAPDVYGGAPYYADVTSATFRAGGRDWVMEAVILEVRRAETVASILEILQTLRAA